jgi:mannosylglucosylglycerate synthase
MPKPAGAIIHYSIPPVIGGVESVIRAHAEQFVQHQYPLRVIAGRGGEGVAFPPGVDLVIIPELDTNHPRVLEMNAALEKGKLPPDFTQFTEKIANHLRPQLERMQWVIVHNVFSKHFNLAFTAALFKLLDEGAIHGCIAWCHDLSWTSEHSRSKLFPDYPWELLRSPHPHINYVVISEQRRKELASLFDYPQERIRIIYNGVDPHKFLGISGQGWSLCRRLELLDSDLILLMPVRITQAKNIEYAVRVIAELKTRGSRAMLVVTGPPDPHDTGIMEYYRSLLDLRAQLKLDHEVRFVYESGPTASKPFFIDEDTIGELYRLADLVFLPSHREGFGMPVLEAGLAGRPVISTPIPAALEIGGQDVFMFDPSLTPAELAEKILTWVTTGEAGKIYRLRRRTRQNFTWEAIFERQIEPLINS